MILKGLSVTVAGVVLSVVRDTKAKVARVRAMMPEDNVLSDVDREAVEVSGRLLVERARRFLGIGWRVEDW